MNRLFAAAAVLAVWSGTAAAAEVTEFDAFATATQSSAVPGTLSPRVARLVARGQIAHTEPKLGVPTFFWAAQDPHAPSLKDFGLNASEAARRYLFDYAELYRTSAAALADMPLVKVHDTGRGAIVADFQKVVDGKPLFRDTIHVVMNQRLQLVALTGYLNPATRPLVKPQWDLSRSTALAIAFSDLTGVATQPKAFEETGKIAAGYHFLRQRQSFGEGQPQLAEDVRVKDVWFGMPDGLIPAYYVEVIGGLPGTDADYVSYVVSAKDGRVLFRHSLTEADSYSYRVWAHAADNMPLDGPQGELGTPYPSGTPNGYVPPFIAPSLVTLQNGPISTNDPWLPKGALYTIGNNVEAYADLAAADGFTVGSADQHAAVSSANTFDYTFNPNLNPQANTTQVQAAITQLFYTNNFVHDWYYDNGFDEAAGNGQTDNFGRGGVDGDSLKVEAQDYGGTNNANMSTPPDGNRPRMQMYLWSEAKISVTAPAAIVGDFAVGTAQFGAQTFDVTGDVSYAADSSGQHTACVAFPAGAFTGKIALVDRGTCPFSTKAETAAAAGAIGVIIANNAAGILNMSGSTTQPVTIGVLSISQADGLILKGQIANNVTVTTHLSRGARDGTIDNGIVAHEWGHYISNRLVGNSSGLTTNQARGMGEGWADFHALLLLVRDTDRAVPGNTNFTGTYATAGYVANGTDLNGYYWGIRRAPYSVDFTRNGFTFKHITNNVALPTTFPIAFGQSGATNAEVHNTGEVWAATLWENYVALLQATSRLTFAQAQERMKDYLVAGYKITPNAPTFVEARDAILAAAFANDPADFTLMAQAFARRGLGIGAAGADRYSTSNANVTESFLTGNDAAFVSASLGDTTVYCDKDGTLDSGETGPLTLTLKNTGHGDLTGMTGTVTSTTPGVTFPGGGSVTFGTVGPYGTVSATTDVKLDGATGATPLEFSIEFNDASFAVPGARTATFSVLGNVDETLATSATDDAEAPSVAWSMTHDTNLSDGDFARREQTLTDHAFFGPNIGAPSDLYMVSPPLQVGTGNFSFSFDHRWDFEGDSQMAYDGAVIEVSDDGGQTWTDVATLGAAPGYNGTITDGQPYYASQNPLILRPAYVRTSAGFSSGTMVNTNIDLGTQFAGKTVQVRFRIGSDDGSAFTGWFIDNIAFTGITNTPFNQRVVDPGVCINRPPVAAVGADQTVDERTLVTLDGSPSTDPDGDQLQYLWTQTGTGPVVQIVNGQFTAPEIAADTELEFQLVVSDGQYQSAPVTTHVTVKQVNRGPTVSIGVPELVTERMDLVLTAVTYDPENDPLTYTWSQVAGPTLVNEPSGTVLKVKTDEVTEDQPVTFRVDVSDGTETATSTVTFTVKNVNRAPVASAGEDVKVKPGESVKLGGGSSDPDGDALSFTWRQVSGPTVDLGDGTKDSVQFTAPNVTGDTELIFDLAVTDGTVTATDRVVVTVNGATASGCGCSADASGQSSFIVAGMLAALAFLARRRRA